MEECIHLLFPWLFQWDQISVDPLGLALPGSFLCNRTALLNHKTQILHVLLWKVQYDSRAPKHNKHIVSLQHPKLISSHDETAQKFSHSLQKKKGQGSRV